MRVWMNGSERDLHALGMECSLAEVVKNLGLKEDRIAVEHNGGIVPRNTWTQAVVRDGDKLEVVHFVGGGTL